MISVGAFQTCFQVVANEDVFVEGDEVFTIFVKSANPNDMTSTNATLATITDNDGKAVF